MLNVIREAIEQATYLESDKCTVTSPYIADISSVGDIGQYITRFDDEVNEVKEWITNILSLELPAKLDKSTLGEMKTYLRSLGYYPISDAKPTSGKQYMIYKFKQKGHLS